MDQNSIPKCGTLAPNSKEAPHTLFLFLHGVWYEVQQHVSHFRREILTFPRPLHPWKLSWCGRPLNFKGYLLEHICLRQGCQTHFHPGHTGLMVAFKGPNVILGLHKCNYLTRGKELYIWPFEGNCEADGAPSENEFDTPGVRHLSCLCFLFTRSRYSNITASI